MAGAKRDYYEVLGVDRSADADGLKKAFRKLAMQHHPDRNPGDHAAEERFKEASEAYEILSDPDRRARYDRFGHQGVEGFGGQGGGFNTVNINDIFGEIFGDIFGGGRRRGGRSRGQDLRYNLEIAFEEAAFGSEVTVKIPRPKRCEECAGSCVPARPAGAPARSASPRASSPSLAPAPSATAPAASWPTHARPARAPARPTP